MAKDGIRYDRLIKSVIGSPEQYSLEHRFFNAACFVGGVAGIVSTLLNLVLDFNLSLTISTLTISLLFIGFYYLSIKKNIYKSLIIPFILLSIITLTYVWFINAGSNGPVLYVILAEMVLFMVLTRGSHQLIAVVATIASVSFMIFYEMNHPDAVIPYLDDETRYWDLFFTAILTILLVAFIASFMTKSYQEEREIVITQRDKILAQNVKIRLAERELLQSKKFTESIISNAQDGIFVIDLKGRFILVNDSFVGMTGYSRSFIIRKKFDELLLMKEQNEDNFISKIISKGLGGNYELEFIKKSGERFPGIISAAYLNDASNKPEAVVITVKDMTEYKNILSELTLHRDHLEELVKKRTAELRNINKKLLQSKEKAEESDRLKSAFLSNMSHEIRTPMNAITGFAQLLKDPATPREATDQYIDIIINKGNLLLNIINDIIDISKVEAGKIEIIKSGCNIDEMFIDLYATFENVKKTGKKSHIDLRFVKPDFDSDITIYTDPFRLKQILTNLIDNAIKFTERGFVEFGYSVILEAKRPRIRFYVHDSGIGIPEDKQKLVFNRFRQIEDSHTRRFGGTGLGLTISKKLVELLSGDLKVESQEGEGSTFFFAIPFKPVKVTNNKTKPKSRKKIKPDWRNRIVLIVEDNNSSFLLLKSYMESTGIKILRAGNGEEAVKMCEVNPDIELVLMDIQLPIMDGYKATSLIKEMRKDLPVIAQTAHAMVEDVEESKKAGCDEHVSKPVKKEVLLSVMSEYLN
jgi:PAS domain S-box-containing protein